MTLDELRNPEKGPGTVRTLVYIMIGPILWGLHFTVVYCGHTLACLFGFSESAILLGVVILTAAAGLVLVAALVMQDAFARLLGIGPEAAGRRTYDSFSRIAGLLSLVALVWTGSTVVILGSCVQGR